MENKAFKIAGIKNLMRTNYSVSVSLIDLEAEIDDSLTMSENWGVIKKKVVQLCEKKNKVLW